MACGNSTTSRTISVVMRQDTERRIQAASKTDLARDTGLHVSYISCLLNGKRSNPTLSVAARVAKALGISLDDLNGFLERKRDWVN